jgi:hypothetical protein
VGERLGFGGYFGATLILASILVAEFAARRGTVEAAGPLLDQAVK